MTQDTRRLPPCPQCGNDVHQTYGRQLQIKMENGIPEPISAMTHQCLRCGNVWVTWYEYADIEDMDMMGTEL